VFYGRERCAVLIDLVHHGCGGSVAEDWSDPYCFEGDDAKTFGEKIPRYVCGRCGKEILGDREIQIVERANLTKNLH
jgi:hypothetical protein